MDKKFLMPIEDVFQHQGPRHRGYRSYRARSSSDVGEEVEIVGMAKEVRKTVVTGVEMFNKTLDEGQAGDNVGILLRGVEKKELERGQVIAAPGSITPHTKFHAEVYVLTQAEGGRHTPFFAGYKPQFYFRTTDVTGQIHGLLSEEGKSGRDVYAGRQHHDGGRNHRADRYGRRVAFRHSRRRPNRRRRRCDQDS